MQALDGEFESSLETAAHTPSHTRERGEMSLLIGSFDWQDKIDDDPAWRATVVRCIVECMRN